MPSWWPLAITYLTAGRAPWPNVLRSQSAIRIFVGAVTMAGMMRASPVERSETVGRQREAFNDLERVARARSLTLAIVSATLLAGLAGCGRDHVSSDGPLSSASSRHGLIPNGAICAPGDHPETFGEQIFTNFGKTTVVLDRVTLLHPRNERLVGSYAVPGSQLIGVPGNWPVRHCQGFELTATKRVAEAGGRARVTELAQIGEKRCREFDEGSRKKQPD